MATISSAQMQDEKRTGGRVWSLAKCGVDGWAGAVYVDGRVAWLDSGDCSTEAEALAEVQTEMARRGIAGEVHS